MSHYNKVNANVRFPIRWRLLVLFMVVLGVFAPGTTAVAQVSRAPVIALLDIETPAAGNTILIRQTTDALAIELQRAGYDVVPRTQILAAIQELDLPVPLEGSALERLGNAVSADYIAVGRLERFVRREGRLNTTLSVLLQDVATGEYANGARVTGTAVYPANRNPIEASEIEGSTFTRLQNAAISDAAYNAVKTLRSFQLPQATVLNSTANTVLLNGGVRNGIRVGQEFIILRNGARVGRVRVTGVSSQDATAVIVDPGIGIRPEDRARAIVDPRQLPERP